MSLASRLHFRSFRSRLLTFIVGLLVLVLGAVLLAVDAANEREARRHIDEALDLTANAFRRSLADRERILLEKARLLSSDFAFKEASVTGDHATLLSAVENHQERVAADVMMLLDLSGAVRADTLHPQVEGTPSSLLPLVSAAMDSERGEATGIQAIDEVPYQLVVVPLFTPAPSAWIVIGFALDAQFALSLGTETRTQVTLLWRGLEAWDAFSSTLPKLMQREIEAQAEVPEEGEARGQSMRLMGEEFVSRVVAVANVGGRPVAAVLQRSLPAALAPYRPLRTLLLAFFALGLVLSLAGGVLMAQRVTRPVASLAQAARRISAGDYDEPVAVTQHDEVGLLANSFNQMMRGLAERDAARDLLGKVVSREIAEELLSKEIELGGEQRMVTMLFTDLRGFTTVAEAVEPQQLVRIVNSYLGWASGIVEEHGGVVAQYVGDAVMALFGAPLQHEDDATRAVRVAMALRDRLPALNAQLASEGLAPLALGAGVHSGEVVAGNMGSPTRLNYSVVGDAVNLASRIEGLTKMYGVAAIVSEVSRAASSGIVYRELDQVQVKGRKAPLRIFEPMAAEGALAPDLAERLARHEEALACYRARDWDAAERHWRDLGAEPSDARLYETYLARLDALRRDPPPAGWDGTSTFTEK